MSSIFYQDRDQYKWSKHKEYVALMDNIDDQTKNNYIKAIERLEQIFETGFLKGSFNHPVRQMISNKAPWQLEELIEFSDTLQKVKADNANYNKLLSKLKSPTTCKIEGMPFVEIARRYIKNGFNISLVEEDKVSKTPDIYALNPENGYIVYIEITKLNNSVMQNNTREQHHFFFNEFHYNPPHFPFVGKQKINIDNSEFAEIKQIMANAKNKVKEGASIVYYTDRRFWFMFAPFGKEEELSEICSTEKINLNDFEGLAVNFDDTTRINNKINKAKQIPKGQNGLLYIDVSPIFFMVTDLAASIARLEANIAKYPNLLGIVIFAKHVGSESNESIKFENHLYARRSLRNLCCESLFIFNHKCDVVISKETMEKIYQTNT